jgi:hypothetical protein
VTRVTIVGAGNMGRGIGTRVVAGGHQVEIVGRDPADAQHLAETSVAPPEGVERPTAPARCRLRSLHVTPNVGSTWGTGEWHPLKDVGWSCAPSS